MIKISMRFATTEDIDELLILFAKTIKSTCKNDYNQEQIDAWVSSAENKDLWKGFIDNQFFLIAETNSKIIGFGSLENGNYLSFMYVHKNYLRLGVANTIYQALKKESQRLGYNKLTANISKTAQPFFESKGFTVVRENKNIRNNIEIINYHMTL